ncbi:RIP metalloprotease RseP [Flavobacterium columnare]|uniref:Zinc metalloprotease n=1 Tax=Flavobacterium columnare (strain ATCC 49512 / CIP 103533 / TG 44/87) TaxID=1041826 RepID=G8X8M3_FLACA|nr:RIP metalloprotease RseP [Flavobacterium columnare]AEW86474.1 M50 family membrane-associated zinc metalloprotease precursor [Flavobacterium columnare ATCC 49512]ANO49656.1 M50 family membrane-associated zinc metalloprotease precursor [Flavobacterium columnare]APT22408.1 RIP metalloprotease RseP [Flavobacterium columnare]MBF6656005.1 RIP metalloprotease RseP [Flavobacterium columnare]PDS27014.1 RIP metalloprotease RseP [Flavobacterium columnare] [Flavobacterium columnare NBRC 100251 = ATCC 2
MDTLIQIAQILFILSVLVILHEFGHYLPAKLFKIRVEKFYLFMDPWFSLLKKKIGDTEWGIGWLPIGGYVKLAGMMDESMDKEQMAQPAQPWEFRSKPAWQRLIVMLGGVTVNVVLAWFIYIMLFTNYGQKYIATNKIQQSGLAFSEVGKQIGFKNGDKIIAIDGEPVNENLRKAGIDVLFANKVTVERANTKLDLPINDTHRREIISSEGKNFISPRLESVVVDSIIPGLPAEKAKLQKADQIVSINNHTIKYFDELKDALQSYKNQKIQLGILRSGNILTLEAQVSLEGNLGFTNKMPSEEEMKAKYLVTNQLNFLQAIPEAIKESYSQIKYKIKEFKLLLSPKTGAYKKVKSPIGITKMLPTVWDWEFIWNFTAMFSIGLAFMNLLPIPGLDGGHALFTLAEMITGKKLNDKAAEVVQTIGMVILLSLMALTFGKDIFEIIAQKFF